MRKEEVKKFMGSKLKEVFVEEQNQSRSKGGSLAPRLKFKEVQKCQTVPRLQYGLLTMY